MHINKSHLNILAVEDNDGDFFLVEDFISDYFVNASLTRVANFEGLKSKIQNSNYDLILLDLSLPDISKDDLITEASEINESMPVLTFTGYEDIEFASKAIAMGISDYLLKDEITPHYLYKSILYAVERHTYLKSIRESQKKYENIFNSSPEPILIVNKDSHRFTEVNNAATEIFGFSREEFGALHLSELFVEDEYFRLIKQLVQSPCTKLESLDCNEYLQLTKSKRQIVSEVSVKEILVKNIPSYLILCVDITEKKKSTETIKNQNERLKNIAWTQSHVVRAPLARILGIIDMLEQENLNEIDRNEMQKNIVTSAKELDQIIRDIVQKTQSIE